MCPERERCREGRVGLDDAALRVSSGPALLAEALGIIPIPSASPPLFLCTHVFLFWEQALGRDLAE